MLALESLAMCVMLLIFISAVCICSSFLQTYMAVANQSKSMNTSFQILYNCQKYLAVFLVAFIVA